MLYSELQCSEAIHKAVERMGFAEMTEVQEKTIPVMLAGRDVIAKAPTGTGKTCAFGIPVAEHIDPALKAPQAVILAPTRELAQQIAEELTGLTYFMPEVQSDRGGDPGPPYGPLQAPQHRPRPCDTGGPRRGRRDAEYGLL